MKPPSPTRSKTGWVVTSHVGGMHFHKVFNDKKIGGYMKAKAVADKFCLFLHEKRMVAQIEATKIITDCLEEVYDGGGPG